MKDLNHVLLVGNVGQDPKVHTFDDGNKVVRLTVATNRNWKDTNGEWQQQTEWHNVQVRGPGTERAAALTKGARIMVQGSIQTRKYQKEGQERYATEIIVAGPGAFVADQTPKQQAMAEAARHEAPAPRPTSGSSTAQPWEDDIPF